MAFAGPQSAAPAKIARPQGNRPVARPRLFERLDGLRRVPVIWLAAAPGAGKTTLVSSWLAERGRPGAPAPVWYQLDADDGDVATFFHYLGIAVRQAAQRDDLPLPALLPEYLSGLPGFTRRYAETMAAALGPAALLVLDNYEAVPDASPLHEVVRELASSLPAGSNLVVLSRSEPPAVFARLRLHEALVVLDGRELDLTRDEAMALATARAASSSPSSSSSSSCADGVDPRRIERLLHDAQGWLAGFTLLLGEGGGSAAAPASGRSRQLLFDYFASELFERFDAATQQALLATALLPAMTLAGAQQVSGDADVGGVLADLHRRNCFVVRRGAAEPPIDTAQAATPAGAMRLADVNRSASRTHGSRAAAPAGAVRLADGVSAADRGDAVGGDALAVYAVYAVYEYHALFRAFLLNRAAAHFAPAAWRALQRRAAGLLANDGQPDAAAGLYGAANDADGLAALALREAPALIAAGRHRTLGSWLNGVTPAAFEASPWLYHWQAAARLPFDPAAARADFERAYAGFQRGEGDAVGLYATWSGAMESFFVEARDFSPADPWIAEFERLRQRHPAFPSRASELRTYWAMGTLLYRRPGHPLLPGWARRGLALLEPHGLAPAERDLAVLLGGYLIVWFLWRGETSQARGVIERIAPWSGPKQERSPMVAIQWSCAVALYHSVQGQSEACLQAVQDGLAIAGRSGLQAFDFQLAAQTARCGLVTGDVDDAERWMAEMARTMRGHGHLSGAFYRHLRSNAAAQRGNWQQAVEHARGGLAMALDSGVPYVEAHCRIDLARALIGQGGDEDRAHCAEHLEAAQAIGRAMGSRLIDHLCLEARAAAAFLHGDDAQGLDHLREALALSRAMDGAIWLMAGPAASAPLYDRALAAGIEVEHVRQLIRRHRIAPPEPATAAESWPWPIRLYTLGRFDILRDDEPLLRPAGKVQHKPLELLKCLCALGGQAVAQDPVCDALWPDADGDAADQALRSTLHRLRKLLQSDGAVRLEDRRLHLDPNVVWADCLAFDRVAHHPQLADRDALRRALDRYRGDFLPGESAPWAVAFRERLRAQHLRMAERLGALLEADGDAAGAIGCWLRAIEVEPLAEALYRRLMQAYARLDRRAEALAVYQRCRLALIGRLGVSPSAETQALHRGLVDAG